MRHGLRKRGARLRTSLLLRFGVVSAVLTVLLGVTLTAWLSNFIRSTNVDHARETADFSVELSLNAIDWHAGQQTLITAAQLAETTRLLRASTATGKFVAASCWAAGGIVTYGAEPGRTGTHEGIRAQVTVALGGQQTWAVITRPQAGVPDPSERKALARYGPLLETYTPVRLGDEIVSAVVLYQPWNRVQRLIDHETRQMQLLVVSGFGVLWLGLMRLVLSTSRRLRTQAATNWRLASHDPLTDLPNRKLLSERVQQALAIAERSGRHVSLLLFDLNGFKQVNDTLGHHCGDLLLQQIGPRLTTVLREGDFVARLGGDEFVVVLPALDDARDAAATAKRLTAALAEPFALDAVSLNVEASIGIAISPDHGLDFDDLLEHADVAMYAAKAAGTGYATYSATTARERPAKPALLGSLRDALSDPSQFVLDFQPKAALLTGEVHEAEALLRWRHPPEGLLARADFIPLAERTGLIHPLTELVLDRVLAQIATWTRQGLQLAVSVNVSTRCLLDATLPNLVSRLLVAHEVAASMLILEITESAVMADPDRAIEVMQQLKDIGVGLAIDDFGAGYGSMAHLKRLPVSQLKIDRSFIAGMTDGLGDASVVRSCLQIGSNFGLTVVAQGVEAAEVWDQLAAGGCDLAQGRFICDPLPAHLLRDWLAERSKHATERPISARLG